MLIATYQPLASLRHIKGMEEYEKAGRIAQPEIPGELDMAWCFPASTWREAFVHSLLTAPNCPQAFILLDTENYRRIDKVRHYAAISAAEKSGDCSIIEDVHAFEDPDCPDDRSEFVIPPEELDRARLVYAFHPVLIDDKGFGHLHSRRNGSLEMTVFTPFSPDIRSMFAAVRSKFEFVGYRDPETDKVVTDVKFIFEPERLMFLFTYLPLLYEIVDGKSCVQLDAGLPVISCINFLMDCYNRMGTWSCGECDGETYAKIFADAMLPIQAAEYFERHACAFPANGKLPGRNDPCPCGSGRKFKKCHARIFS